MVKIVPKSKYGLWALALIAVMPIMFIVGSTLSSTLYANIEAADGIIADLAVRPVLAVSMLSGMLSGVVAFGLGLTSYVKYKERALLIYLPIILGGALLFLLFGELIFQH